MMRAFSFISFLRSKWILGATYLEVEVVSSCLSGVSNRTNALATSHGLTYRHRISRHVCVECLYAVAVIDNNIVTVSTIPSSYTRDNNGSTCSGVNRGARGSSNINTVPSVNSLRKTSCGSGVSKGA